MYDATHMRAAQEASYASLQQRLAWLNSRVDDQDFVREASCLLAEIRTSLHANDLPADLAVAYGQLERQVRAYMQQRHLLPRRPLF